MVIMVIQSNENEYENTNIHKQSTSTMKKQEIIIMSNKIIFKIESVETKRKKKINKKHLVILIYFFKL